MKPNPFSGLNHFTVPVLMECSPSGSVGTSVEGDAALRTQHTPGLRPVVAMHEAVRVPVVHREPGRTALRAADPARGVPGDPCRPDRGRPVQALSYRVTPHWGHDGLPSRFAISRE